MPFTNLTEQQGCLIALKFVGGAVALLLLLSLLEPMTYCGPSRSKLREQVEMKMLEMAVTSYQTEYGERNSLAEFWTSEGTPIASEGELLQVLMANSDRLNPHKIAFWEPPAEKSKDSRRPGVIKRDDGTLKLVDGHGNPFWLQFDCDLDGSIRDPEDPNISIPATVIIYSAGPDGDYSTWKDNVKSWAL